MNLRSRGILKLDGHEGAEGAELWRNEDGVGGVEYVRPINKTKNPQFKNSTWWRSDIHLSIIALLAVRVSRHSQTLREKFYPTFSSNKNHQPTIRTAEGVCRPFWYAESSYPFVYSIIDCWRMTRRKSSSQVETESVGKVGVCLLLLIFFAL